MTITALPALDRTATSFRTDTDTFFGVKLPLFSVEAEAARVEINANTVTATAKAVEATQQAEVSTAKAVLTAQDKVQTGLDRIQTGLDRVNSNTASNLASSTIVTIEGLKRDVIDAVNVAATVEDWGLVTEAVTATTDYGVM